MQDPTPSHPTDPTNSPQRDLPADHEAQLTPLIHARISDREPEPGARHRAHAHVDRRTHDARLTATRGLAATKNTTRPASIVHIPAALDQEITETAGRHPRTDGRDRSASTRDKLHPLPDDREASR